MDLSIVIPVYNLMDYIEECVDSIISQEFTDIEYEVIIVNDGSTDDSLKIISNKYGYNKRIKIISKQNGGLSSARNRGIVESTGKYIYFIDGDDFIREKNALRDMFNEAICNDADMVIGNAIWYFNENKQYIQRRDKNVFKPGVYEGKKLLADLLDSESYSAPVPFNMYRLDMLKGKLNFMDGIYHEDELFMPQAFIMSKKVVIIDKNFYMYRQREGSIMNSELNYKKLNDIIYIFKQLDSLLDEIEDKRLKKSLGVYIYKTLMFNICKYKFKKVDYYTKKILLKNAFSIGDKIRAKIVIFNPNIYLKLEKKYLNIKDIFRYNK